jgi:hypothetical protein
MIEAHIEIDRELVVKGSKKAYARQALHNSASFYGGRAFVVFLAVALADALFGGGHLIGVHLSVVGALGIAAAFHSYFEWEKKLAASARGYVLDVVLDDEGVTFTNDRDKRIEWDSYSYFKEYEDYLEITHSSGDISFLPKHDEIADVIVFTKSKIPNKNFI